MSSSITGKCMCGAVTISATPDSDGMANGGLGACHCDMCRAWTSGAFIEIAAKNGSVKIEGPAKTFQSSEWAERAFCEICGSPLWYRVNADGAEPGQYQLSAGLFENAGDLDLNLEVFIDSKPEGYAFAGHHKTMTRADIYAMFAPPEEGAQE